MRGTCALHTTVTNCHPFPRQLTAMAREDMAAGAAGCWIRAVRGPLTGICLALMTDEGHARLLLRLKTPEPGHGDKVGTFPLPANKEPHSSRGRVDIV